MSTDMEQLKRNITRLNLERLSKYDFLESLPRSGGSNCDVALSVLQKWSTENQESIQMSITAQAFGGKEDINWDIAFLPFMESMAVYLRDYGKVREAWGLHQEYLHNGANDTAGLESAIDKYLEADDQIKQLAQDWRMDYTTICDLPDKSPDEQKKWAGPFCGAFFTTSAQEDSPFIGLAFKGTNPKNNGEDRVDINYQMVAAGPDFLHNQFISQGVLTGLFGNFEGEDGSPYKHIFTVLNQIANTIENPSSSLVRTHVTGHSLGGSYSSLCMAQLMIDTSPIPVPRIVIVMGDEYTFGAPRVGSQEWAEMNRYLVKNQAGRTWRIVNNEDIVPKVPPSDLKKDTGFYHIDSGVQIYSDQKPGPIPTEIGGDPPAGLHFDSLTDFVKEVLNTGYHCQYYNLEYNVAPLY